MASMKWVSVTIQTGSGIRSNNSRNRCSEAPAWPVRQFRNRPSHVCSRRQTMFSLRCMAISSRRPFIEDGPQQIQVQWFAQEIIHPGGHGGLTFLGQDTRRQGNHRQ